MAIAAGALIVLAVIFGPSLWVKFVMRRYSIEKPEMPGTGGELAKHLIKRFSLKDVELTSDALMFFGYGIIAFALVKVLTTFFFARDNTKTPFYVSSFIVLLNIIISVSLFDRFGFLIIPIATSFSTWVGVFIFLYLMKRNNFLLIQKKLYLNIFKIVISTIIMSIALTFILKKYSIYLDYTYIYKSVWLLFIVGFVGIVYFISCYLLGLLKIKNYKTN